MFTNKRFSPFSLLSLSLLLVFAFASCQPDDIEEPATQFTPEQLANIDMCLTPNHIPNRSLPGELDERACGDPNFFWSPGETIKVKFLTSNPALQAKVMGYAKQWEQYANIHFQVVTSGLSDLRVSFTMGIGTWSAVGTDCWGLDTTMNLGINSATSESTIKRYTLHEFGHALGMKHEHQHPLADIPWNKPAAYAYYQATQGWSKKLVDQWVLNEFDPLDVTYADYDPNSIMHYHIDAALTWGFTSTPWNFNISELDKTFIRQMYSPFRVQLTNKAWGKTIRIKVAGIRYTIPPGDFLNVPVTPGLFTTISILEQVGGVWYWDNSQSLMWSNLEYRIVPEAAPNHYKIEVDEDDE